MFVPSLVTLMSISPSVGVLDTSGSLRWSGNHYSFLLRPFFQGLRQRGCEGRGRPLRGTGRVRASGYRFLGPGPSGIFSRKTPSYVVFLPLFTQTPPSFIPYSYFSFYIKMTLSIRVTLPKKKKWFLKFIKRIIVTDTNFHK